MEGGRAANLSFDLRLGFTTGEIYSDTNAHKVALWLAKPEGRNLRAPRTTHMRRQLAYLSHLRRRAAPPPEISTHWAASDCQTDGGNPHNSFLYVAAELLRICQGSVETGEEHPTYLLTKQSQLAYTLTHRHWQQK